MWIPRQFFIAGAGLMGSGIAQTLANAGHTVHLFDLKEESLIQSKEKMKVSLEKLHLRNPDQWRGGEEVLSRIQWTHHLENAAEADYIIEAVPESFELKSGLFQKLHLLCKPDTLFFSNTSAIPISKLAKSSGRPTLFCGLHFFNPVPLMPLVEIICGTDTDRIVAETAMDIVRSINKSPVQLRKDSPGFIVNRLFIAMLLQAIRLVESGVASVEDIDTAMKLGCGHKMGPLETADFSGLDVFLSATEAIFQESGEESFRPPALLQEKVRTGYLGRKTGAGFYTYSEK